MEKLHEKSQKKINSISLEFKRYLHKRINLDQRLISIRGARGTGKTTMLLQIASMHSKKEVLYVALDDLFFTNNSLYSLAEYFYKTGGELLLLDEVHKYPNWSREIKLVYDDFASMQVIFTSSSVLDIYKGESDLSRRASSYILHEMSFREYLEFQHNIIFPIVSLEDIIQLHEEISLEMAQKFKPLKYLQTYLKHGNYPYYSEDEEDYFQKIRNTINLVMDIDLPACQHIDYTNIAKFKRLLFVLASNVPFTPNISKLSKQIGMDRNALVHAIQLMNKAELIHTLYKKTRSIRVLNKPDKIWLHNSNLSFALSNKQPETGSVRETFFISHIIPDHQVSLPLSEGDFWVDEKYLFEIGGKNKTRKQIQECPNAYLVKDFIETGYLINIPLWLFGFLY